MNIYVLYGFLATIFTWGITALGAATVIFFKKPQDKVLNIFLGFSAGVMIAASFWSLLEPAITTARQVSVLPAYFVAAFGFCIGGFFMIFTDYAVKKLQILPHISKKYNNIFMLVLSITLHNIPEGLAVGVAFGSIGSKNGETLISACTIALGIAIQNFPEGAAVSLPLKKEGLSSKKSFLIGQASAIVEPIAAIIGASLVVTIKSILPYALSFAAGAMILVAVHEIIPECQNNRLEIDYNATFGILGGFVVMMILDVMLG